MTLRIVVLAGALAIGHTEAWAQQKPLKMSEPIVHFGLYERRQDGRSRGSAGQTAEEQGWYETGSVYVAPCGSLGAADTGRPVAAAATDVWSLSTRVLSLTEDTASAQVTWQPVRRNSRDEGTAPQSTTLTLKRGERVTLEEIHVPANGKCEGRTVSLEVVFASRDELYPSVSPQAAVGGVANVATGNATAGAPPRVFGEASGGIANVAVARAGQPRPTSLHADLWLVRSAPGRTDETTHVTSRVMSLPLTFAFAPLSIEAAGGLATVQVEGTVEVGLTPEGEPRFFFSASRRLGFIPANRPARDNAPMNEGSSKTSVPVPGPDQILSFELPPLRLPDGTTLPDRFSVRVRLTPTAMQPLPRSR